MTFEAIPDLLADILEQQRKTTDAIIGLAEALAGARAKAIETTKADKPKAKSKADAGKPAAAAPSAESQAPSAAAATTAESPSKPVADAPAVEFPQVKEAIIALVKAKGRDTTVAMLASFGVTNGSELKVEQYAAALAAAKKAMA